MKCSACGANVRAIGDTTMHYENIDHEIIDELKSEQESSYKLIEMLFELLRDQAGIDVIARIKKREKENKNE